MSRLFVGTFLSPQQQEELGRLSEKSSVLTQLWKRKLRWVKPIKLHLTWFFLGNVEEVAIPKLTAELETSLRGLPSTAVTYTKAEFWPNPKMARQLVLTADIVPEPVQTTVMAIRARLTPLVGEADYKTFKPHITLIRLESKDTPPALRKLPLALPEESGLKSVLPLKQTIAEVSLIQSHLGKGAEEYERLTTFKLL